MKLQVTENEVSYEQLKGALEAALRSHSDLSDKYDALKAEYDKLRDEHRQATKKLEDLKEEKSSVTTTMPLFAALIGGFFGGRQALAEDESFWGCVIPGIAFAIFGTGFAYLVFFALQQLAPATRSRENVWKELFWKALVFGGLFLIGAVMSYKFHW